MAELGSQVDVTDGGLIQAFNVLDPDLVLNLAVRNHNGLLLDQSENAVREQLNVNLWGAINLLQNAVAYFVEKSKRGRVILMSSVVSAKPVPGAAVYGASKAAVDHLVRTAALEAVRHGVLINSIQLGYTRHGLFEKIPEKIQLKILEEVPLHRVVTPEEIAAAIRFLFETDGITGTNLKLAGGL